MTRREKRARRKKQTLLLIVIALVVCAGIVFGVLAAKDRAERRRREEEHRQLLEKYPLRQTEIVEACAEEFSLEPARLYAVMLCESSFRPDVVSSVGAIGLMQVTPSSAEWIAGKLGEKDTYTEESLYDPMTNARYGSWYLSYLDERFSGNLVKATAAYHAGQGTVDKWTEELGELTPETIPTEITRAYVQNVLSAKEHYEQLYFSEDS